MFWNFSKDCFLRITNQRIFLKIMKIEFISLERDAAAALGLSPQTLKRWRLDGKIPAHVFVKIGYKIVRYSIPLLLDWQLDPDDLEAQSRAIAAIQAQRPSNQHQKKGRKSAA
jgi:hypothetical protein